MAGPTLALVHSPLIGPRSWLPVAERLRGPETTVVVPSLIRTVAAAAPRFDLLAEVVIEAVGEAPEGVQLVVHSGAGGLVPSIAARAPWQVHDIAFVDATLPFPGRAWMDTAPADIREELLRLAGSDGFLPPWHEWFPVETIHDMLPDRQVRADLCDEMPRIPLSYFYEVAPTADEWRNSRCGYLQLSAGYRDAAAEAASRGWPIVRQHGHHLSAVTHPAVVSTAILALLARLQHGEHGG